MLLATYLNLLALQIDDKGYQGIKHPLSVNTLKGHKGMKNPLSVNTPRGYEGIKNPRGQKIPSV